MARSSNIKAVPLFGRDKEDTSDLIILSECWLAPEYVWLLRACRAAATDGMSTCGRGDTRQGRGSCVRVCAAVMNLARTVQCGQRGGGRGCWQVDLPEMRIWLGVQEWL